MKPTDPSTVEAIPVLPDIEQLGRKRPPAFRSTLAEFAFCFSVMHSVLMAVSQLSVLQPP